MALRCIQSQLSYDLACSIISLLFGWQWTGVLLQRGKWNMPHINCYVITWLFFSIKRAWKWKLIKRVNGIMQGNLRCLVKQNTWKQGYLRHELLSFIINFVMHINLNQVMNLPWSSAYEQWSLNRHFKNY